MINQVKTISDFYYFQLQHTPRTDAFTQKENGKWTPLSIQDFVAKSQHFSLGLMKLGIEKGDRIAIISSNRTEWHLTDLAAQQIGVVNVPIYPNITEEDKENIGDVAQNLRNDSGDDLQLKNRKKKIDFTGKNLDVPGSLENKKKRKKAGKLKDEENELYSQGSEDNENLEQDTEHLK